MIPRLKVGTGVTGAVRYALGEGRDPFTNEVRKKPANDRSRVEWIGGINVGFPIETRADADLARRIMEFDALNQTSPTKRCVKDCVHLALGWRPGEQPTREQMEAAAQGALTALGMGNAKAIFVAHNDEDYSHLHIVASKLNPDTDRAYDLKQSHLKLSRWAEQYERDHSGGIVCTRRVEANQLREAVHQRDAGGVLELMTERRSTFTGQDLERVLSKQIRSELGRAQFAEAVLNHPNAVRLSDQAEGQTNRYSTKAIVETEQHVLRAAHGLARNDRHQVGERLLASVLSDKTFDGISREQALAVRHATGANGLALIDGQAGTGKSYIMTAIRQSYEAQGCKVIGLAPTNIVAQDMHRDGFAKAATVHGELFSLNNERTQWDRRTVVMVDEAAMIDSRNMAMLTAHAYAAGAKLVLIGDDRQLSSIERGGMFGVLKDRYGAAVLAEVRRQHKNDDRRAAELMAEGNFHDALARYDTKGAIHWTRTQPEARAVLVAQWAKDNAADPSKTRFVFAYTNADVDLLNRNIRHVRKEAGQLEYQDHSFETKHGRADFSAGDRVQFTGTDKPRGLYNGQAGTVQMIDGSKFTVRLDGRGDRRVEFDAAEFQDFRHGYAGTIYKGQGRTLDQTYLYHSEHWRSAAGYVALTRHRDKAELFVARNTAPGLKQLARQIARVDERRAASHFHEASDRKPVRPLTPRELAARFNDPALQRRYDQQDVTRRQQEESDRRQQPTAEPAARADRKARGDSSHTAGDTRSDSERRLERLMNSLQQEDRSSREQGGRTPAGRSRTR
jgi:Ti-type conjugative transfer relaxase TraA